MKLIKLLGVATLTVAILLTNTACEQNSKQEDTPNQTVMEEQDNISILLYSIPDETFSLPLTEIPYYQQGEIIFKEEDVFKQWQEGHQPWLAGAVDVVAVMCSNLIGTDVQGTFDNENIELHTSEELRTKNGIVIKVLDKIENKTKVEFIVSGLEKYEITLESPETTGVLFIRDIVLIKNANN